MTRITIQSDGWTYRLSASGHATGSGPTTDRPEVCAAVSAIVYALGGYLKNLEAAGQVELGTFMLESGAAEIEARGEAARQPFGMAAVGLLQIAAKYPDQVSVNIKNCEITGVQSSMNW